MTNVILFIVAHPDDEAIGMGGCLSLHSERKDKVFGISMTDGISSREGNISEEASERNFMATNSSKVLGFTWLDNKKFPDNQMDTIPMLEVIKSIELVKQKIKPNIIYTHSPSDLNVDHKIVFQSTLTAFRPQNNEIWEEIRTFEVPSATDYGHRSISEVFQPNLYINVESVFNKKIEALKCYKDEIRPYPHSRSLEGIKNLAQLRGNQVGLSYAEAFEIIRKIER
ncbi:GlcNAc-PI de-N-acetylase [bacterium]|nr:GlcNAc-PI de-N-acetylase [bacterium]